MRNSIVMGREAEENEVEEETSAELSDWQLPLAYLCIRHTEKIEGSKALTQKWRMKDRMKTVSVALVICLNVGVDPPDVVKTQPCSRQECWIDPLSMAPQKALEAIGASLQRQYERWQPRARYKQSLDPTVEEVKKLCTSLRRNAKEERVLFHYNGHGVPRPTINGEVWVFNKLYTQYIPLSVYDLQTWMGSPSIYVYDCSNAGIILESFKTFSNQREQEIEVAARGGFTTNADAATPTVSVKNCIQLAACGPNELLPMNPELPADLFTACLTTPIKIALRWYVLQNIHKLVPGINLDIIDKIPGQLNDRRTMLGELNWIFTAITDTVAWNTLPRELFQKLFRQDLLVASLFRNFLLAERIMRSYNCTPMASPKLPPTFHHPMWEAWDLALDLCLSQLPNILENGASFQHSPFFSEQLTAFQVWLSNGSDRRSPPEQLPIVLQVLLSQVHRLRALDLLGRFLDLGPWAVSLALSVGIFPYVLKLLQSSARDLRHLLVFIWAKILAVDSSCQADLVKDNGHKYFLSVLADQYLPAEHRTLAAFVMAIIVDEYPIGREAALQGNLVATCLLQLNDPHDLLRQWLAICLGKVWTNYDAARWCGVRDTAHEKLYRLLSDPVPEVRAAAVFALGTYVNNSTERSDHANNIDQGVGMTLLNSMNDGSALVRMELVVALAGLVQQFESQFMSVAVTMEEEKQPVISLTTAGEQRRLDVRRGSDTTTFVPSGLTGAGMRRSASSRSLRGIVSPNVPQTNSMLAVEAVKRVSSTSSLSGMFGYGGVYSNIYKGLHQLAEDPYPKVASMAKSVLSHITSKAFTATSLPKYINQQKVPSHSAPSSPSNKPSINVPIAESSRESIVQDQSRSEASPARQVGVGPHSGQYGNRNRKITDKGPGSESDKEGSPTAKQPIVSTQFFQWCCKHFAQPVMNHQEEGDSETADHLEKDFRFMRAAKVRKEALEEQRRAGFNRLDDQIFINRNQHVPSVLRFHPYEPHLAVADKDGVSLWEWEQGVKLSHFFNKNSRQTRITAMEFINAHDKALLLTATDDGGARLWRNFESNTPGLVSAFQVLSDMLPSSRGSGVVLSWEQSTNNLMASGDVRTIRIWDVKTELKIMDLPTGADSCITSLCSGEYNNRDLIVAGCGDGSIRIYDRRLSANNCLVQTLHEHTGWVANVHLHRLADTKIISASMAGDIRFWDLRQPVSIRTIAAMHGLTALQVHEHADIIAAGSLNQCISVFNQSGDNLSTIKYHEGFMGQRIGSITCMAFHPYKVKLAAGSSDNFVSVYSTPDSRRR